MEKKVSLGYALEQFINELDISLQNFHMKSMGNSHGYLQQQEAGHSKISYDDFSTIIQSRLCPVIHHSTSLTETKKKKPTTMNYSRLVKRLKNKFRFANVLIQKIDKSKVFHLGRRKDYEMKSEAYVVKTTAYECLEENDSLPELIKRTNKYLLDLRLAHWITQKQYEQFCVQLNGARLAHLYYLPEGAQTWYSNASNYIGYEASNNKTFSFSR